MCPVALRGYSSRFCSQVDRFSCFVAPLPQPFSGESAGGAARCAGGTTDPLIFTREHHHEPPQRHRRRLPAPGIDTPGSNSQLQQYVARLHSTLLDRSRPL